MPKYKYTTKQTFGAWTLIAPIKGAKGKWLARCSCGLEKEVYTSHLANGNSTRCTNCYAQSRKTAKLDNTSEYITWNSMLQRCNNPNNKRFKDYGGRGIKVCSAWETSFINFLNDMGKRPDGTSIDRILVNGNYEPNNCRWATAKEQAANTRKSLERGGTLLQLAEEVGISMGALSTRLSRGITLEDAKKINYIPKHNTSGIKGISYDSKTSKWVANITYLKVKYRLGRFTSKEEARTALNLKRQELNLPVL